MTEIISAEELARLNALIDPVRAMRSSAKIAGHLRERQAAWARGDMTNMSGKMLALAAAALDAQRDTIASLTRELEETTEAIDKACTDAAGSPAYVALNALRARLSRAHSDSTETARSE